MKLQGFERNTTYKLDCIYEALLFNIMLNKIGAANLHIYVCRCGTEKGKHKKVGAGFALKMVNLKNEDSVFMYRIWLGNESTLG